VRGFALIHLGHVGTVENVVYERPIDRPSALLVNCGLFGRRLVRFEIDDVLDVDPGLERVCVQAAAVAAATRIRGRLPHRRGSGAPSLIR
jgi:hypothetical protein